MLPVSNPLFYLLSQKIDFRLGNYPKKVPGRKRYHIYFHESVLEESFLKNRYSENLKIKRFSLQAS